MTHPKHNPIQVAIKKLTEKLHQTGVHFAGVGVGVSAGSPAIHVYLATSNDTSKVPSKFEGYHVIASVTPAS